MKPEEFGRSLLVASTIIPVFYLVYGITVTAEAKLWRIDS